MRVFGRFCCARIKRARARAQTVTVVVGASSHEESACVMDGVWHSPGFWGATDAADGAFRCRRSVRLVRERELSVPRTSARVPLQSRRRRCLPLLAPSLPPLPPPLPPSLSHLSASRRLIHPPCCVAASGDESRLADLQVDPTKTRASSRVTCCGRARGRMIE